MERRIKHEENYPSEDYNGVKIQKGDLYFVFGKDVVLEENLKVYLIKKHEVECYRAQ